MARPEVIKTELAYRLREVRKAVGDPPRDEFASTLGIAPKSLANYERGDNVPDANVLLAYRKQFKVNGDWLISGQGSKFHDQSDHAATDPTAGSGGFLLHAQLLSDIADLVQVTHKTTGSEPSVAACVSEAVSRYAELMEAAKNPSDETELRALFPWLQLRISQDLDEAKNAPGKGKSPA